MTLPPSDDPEADIRITRANLDYWYGEAQRMRAELAGKAPYSAETGPG